MSGAASRMRNELAKEVRPDNETKQCGGTSRRRFWRLTIKIRRLYLVSAAVAYDEDAALAVSRFVLCRRRRRAVVVVVVVHHVSLVPLMLAAPAAAALPPPPSPTSRWRRVIKRTMASN